MAKEQQETAEVAEEQPKGKGKKKLLIVLGAIFVVLIVAAGGVIMMLQSPPSKHAAEESQSPPIYASLETFTVNLADGDSYLQIEIKLLIANNEFQEKLKERMPEVRNDILRLLSSKSPDDLSTPEGKDKLAAEIKADINGLLKVTPDKGVKKVLFGAFLIQ